MTKSDLCLELSESLARAASAFMALRQIFIAEEHASIPVEPPAVDEKEHFKEVGHAGPIPEDVEVVLEHSNEGIQPPKKKKADVKKLKVMQDRLTEIIDQHEDVLRDSIKELGCNGDCYNCPKPEKPTVHEQVEACLTSVIEGLGLEK